MKTSISSAEEVGGKEIIRADNKQSANILYDFIMTGISFVLSHAAAFTAECRDVALASIIKNCVKLTFIF